jgi:hypothetical protein
MTNRVNTLQIQATSLITSVAFISICFAILFYLKSSNAPFDQNVTNIFILFISIIYGLFLISLIANYLCLFLQSYEEKFNELISPKCSAYIIALVLFTFSTIVMITQMK